MSEIKSFSNFWQNDRLKTYPNIFLNIVHLTEIEKNNIVYHVWILLVYNKYNMQTYCAIKDKMFKYGRNKHDKPNNLLFPYENDFYL